MRWTVACIVVIVIGVAAAAYFTVPVYGTRGEVSGTSSVFKDDDVLFGTYGFVGDRCAFIICYSEEATKVRFKTRGGGGGGGNSPDGYFSWSQVSLDNGQMIDWKWQCDYAGKETITVQDVEYDLSVGNIFVFHLNEDGDLFLEHVRRHITQVGDEDSIAKLRTDLLAPEIAENS